MLDTPFRKFLRKSLTDFEKHLESNKTKEEVIEQRMRGATEFAFFLVGEPHAFNERTKGKF